MREMTRRQKEQSLFGSRFNQKYIKLRLLNITRIIENKENFKYFF